MTQLLSCFPPQATSHPVMTVRNTLVGLSLGVVVGTIISAILTGASKPLLENTLTVLSGITIAKLIQSYSQKQFQAMKKVDYKKYESLPLVEFQKAYAVTFVLYGHIVETAMPVFRRFFSEQSTKSLTGYIFIVVLVGTFSVMMTASKMNESALKDKFTRVKIAD